LTIPFSPLRCRASPRSRTRPRCYPGSSARRWSNCRRDCWGCGRSCGWCSCRRNRWSHGRGGRRRYRRRWCRCTRRPFAPGDIDSVNAPALIGANGVAGHPPPKPTLYTRNKRQVHHGRDEALRVAAPSLTASNRVAPISADCAVIPADQEATARSDNILIRLPLIDADLQHAAVKAEIGIHARRFQVEVVPECQPRGEYLEKSKGQRVQ
jgi:hypothetical protein